MCLVSRVPFTLPPLENSFSPFTLIYKFAVCAVLKKCEMEQEDVTGRRDLIAKQVRTENK